MLTSSQTTITDLALMDRVKFCQMSNSVVNGCLAHPRCIRASVWQREAKGTVRMNMHQWKRGRGVVLMGNQALLATRPHPLLSPRSGPNPYL